MQRTSIRPDDRAAGQPSILNFCGSATGITPWLFSSTAEGSWCIWEAMRHASCPLSEPSPGVVGRVRSAAGLSLIVDVTQSIRAATVAAMKKRRVKPDIRERFGFAVKLRREELSLTQEDLADKAGIHRTYLSDIERGSRNVSLINIERLAAALSLQMAELFQRVEQA